MALLLLGYCPGSVDSPARGDEVLVPAAGGTAIAIEVDPTASESESGVLEWASRQNAVLCRYITDHDVLPVPIGAVFSGCKAVRDYVADQADMFRITADSLSGAVEYSLLLTRQTQEIRASKTTDGRNFLAARSQARRQQRAVDQNINDLVLRVQSVLQAGAQDIKITRSQKEKRILTLAALVQRSKVAPLIDQLKDTFSDGQGMNVHCSFIGPCPPYSFIPEAAH